MADFFNFLKSISTQSKGQLCFTFDSKKEDAVYVLTYFWIIAFILLLRDIFVGQFKELSELIIKDNYQEELRKFYVSKLGDLSNNEMVFSVSSSGSKYASAAKSIYGTYFKSKSD